jgi:sigma-B regulation protein RsbU (phosphoserine phosphatase)
MLRILVVDDQEDSRDLTEGALLSAGYNDIVTAESGWDALKTLDVGRPTEEAPPVDLLLLDIVMPEMDGVEACARIRNDARYADMPIIMVTSLDDVDSLANAFVAGATDYITKPVNRVELVARVRSALRLKQELDRRLGRERELLAFLSNWGDRRAGLLIDETTGLFVGEAAEAYLTALRNGQHDEVISILAVTLDRFEVYRAANGEDAARTVLAEVSRAVRRLAATVGIVAAAYRNGVIILVAPEVGSTAARELGETLRTAVSKLRLRNSESVVADYVTASVAAITGKAKQAIDRIHLLTHAIAKVQDAASSGGDRVLAFTL